MGLTSPILEFILSRSKKYGFKGPLITYGNQDIYASAETVKQWAKKYKLTKNTPKIFYPTTSLGLSEINIESKNYIHAKSFFAQIGIKEKDYFDVDKFDFDKPKILHDLQKPFPKKYENFFNLTVDSGTIEHIFDIKSVMVNIVKTTRIGGYVLQGVPTNNFLDHGFYQIQPTFFYDFYKANGFKIIEAYRVEQCSSAYRFYKYQPSVFSTFFVNPYSRIGSLFLVQKIKNVNSIVNPTQFAYQKVQKESPNLTSKIRSLIPFKYHPFLYIPWVMYQRFFTKKTYFSFKYQ